MQQELKVVISGDATGFAKAADQAERQLNELRSKADQSTKAMAHASGGVNRLGGAMRMQAGGARMLSMQLSQVGQQAMATGNVAQALAIQLPDIGLAFGTIGTAVGLLAGIALPSLVAAFSETGEGSKQLTKDLDTLKDSVEAFRGAAENTRMTTQEMVEAFGSSSPVMRQVLIDLAAIEKIKAHEALHAMNQELANTVMHASYLKGEIGDIGDFFNIETQLRGNITVWKENRAVVDEIRQDLNALAAGGPIDKMAAAAQRLRARLIDTSGGIEHMSAGQRNFLETLNRSIQQMSILQDTTIKTEHAVSGGIVPAMNNAASAIANAVPSADTLLGRINAIAAAAAEAANQSLNMAAAIAQAQTIGGGRGGDPRRFGYGAGDLAALSISGGSFVANPVYPSFGGGGRGGGGGGAVGGAAVENPIVAQLEAVRDALATETEAFKAAYDEQMETLKTALEQKLLTQEEYQELSLRSAQEYREALANIDMGYNGDQLTQAKTFFGEMANAMQSGNEKMLKVAKVFGAAQSLINSYQAYTEVLKDPSLPWFARIPAAVGVLSAGLGMVSAIKGVSSGGGGASAGAGAGGAAAQSQAPAQVSLNTIGDGEFIRRSDLGDLANSLFELYGDRGYVLQVAG